MSFLRTSRNYPTVVLAVLFVVRSFLTFKSLRDDSLLAEFVISEHDLPKSVSLSFQNSSGKGHYHNWEHRWLEYANSKGCNLHGYKTMEEEFKFYRALLKKKPNLFREFEESYEKDIDGKLQPFLWKIVVKNGKVVQSLCKPGKCSLLSEIVVNWVLRFEINDILAHFDNLTLYMHEGDDSKTSIQSHKLLPRFGIKTLDKLRAMCLPGVSETFGEATLSRFTNPVMWPEPLPIFSVSKVVGCHGDILAPSLVFDVTRKPCGIAIPWEKKKNTIYWRGSDTGGGPINGYRKKVLDSVRNSGLKNDVAFSQILHCDKRDIATCFKEQKEMGIKKGIDECQQQQFKFILDIDGNSYSRRFPSIGSTDSCIIRFGTYSTWYHNFLKPGVHYVQMTDADLKNTTSFLAKIPKDKEAEAIAHRMTLASRKVMADGAKCYWLRLLFMYADTFGFS